MRTPLAATIRIRLGIGALLTGLIAPPAALPQTGGVGVDSSSASTRTELLYRLRAGKRSGPRVAYRPGRLERFLLSFEKARTPRLGELNLYGVYPRLGTLERGSNLALGVRFWQPDIAAGLDVHASTLFSIKGYEHYDLQFGLMPHRSRALPPRSWRGDDVYEISSSEQKSTAPFSIYASLRYRHRPEEAFYGLGPDSRREDESSYLQYDALYDLVAGFQVKQWLAFTMRTGYMTFGGGDGRDEDLPAIGAHFDDRSAPGLTGQPDFLRLSPQALIDLRDVPGNPHRGGMLGIEYGYYDDRGGDAFEFKQWALDARGYVPLGSVQRVLALRALYVDSWTPAGSRVPFYLQETLGGSHTLRGFDSFRFRGEDLLLMQAEYRWEGSPAIELALFTDAGSVSEEGAGVQLDNLEWDFGYGVRFKSYRVVAFRFDHAWSNETSRLFFRLSASY